MGKKVTKTIVIAKLRPFDDQTWKRLLLAYTYYLHDRQSADTTASTDNSTGRTEASS